MSALLDTPASPFHAGEQQVQAQLGVREAMEPWARQVVRDHLVEQHALFYAAQPFLVVAARDAEIRPWASLLCAAPGFVSVPDARSMAIAARPVAGDALAGALTPGADIGMLGIELETRRRNRVNGRIVESSDDSLHVAVTQAFGNCPQHIHPRRWQQRPVGRATAASRGERLGDRERRLIERADTCFIASGHRGDGEGAVYGMDASHRGGPAGFVEVVSDTELLLPDYAGNNHFNTLGNLVIDSSIGLLFVDFERGSLLQISGHASVQWQVDDARRRGGAERLIRIAIEAVNVVEDALPLTWTDTDDAFQVRLARRIRESADVMSFEFEPVADEPLPTYAAGQHLPLNLDTGDGNSLTRTYTLSRAPGGSRYRISVKRVLDGRASTALHGLQPGALLDVRAPRGDFVLRPGDRPLLFASAGIGITPILSMVEALVRSGDPRPVHVFHVARDGRHGALVAELRQVLRRHPRAELEISYSRPGPADRVGVDYGRAGRPDAALMLAQAGADVDAYLCGPPGFMADISAGLEAAGLAPARIASESFGA